MRTPRSLKGPARLASALRVLAAVSLLGIPAGPLPAQPEIVFGPSPRALDNRTVFSAEHAGDWEALVEAGVTGVVLNSTFLMETAFHRPPGPRGDHHARPSGAYLDEADIDALAQIVTTTGLAVYYEAGIGLSAEACAVGPDPEAVASRAARTEFDQTVSRLQRAGIPVAAINFDGPFLRLIGDSRKAWSCNEAGSPPHGGGFGVPETVRRASAYMAELRDLVAEAQPQAPAPRLNLLVNLTNWRVSDIPRDRHEGPPSTDLVEVLNDFARLQAANEMRGGGKLIISEIVIDYPFSYVKASRSMFRDRMIHLWNASRRINGVGEAPSLGVITNTRAMRHACLATMPPDDTPFLPFRRDGRPIDGACLAAQIGTGMPSTPAMDTDVEFMRESLIYLEQILPDGHLAELLVTADGDRIGEEITHLYVQSWTINPVLNIWYLRQLGRWMETRATP